MIAVLVQGTVGYVQYAAGLPGALVLVHMAGLTIVVACTAWLWCATTKVKMSAGDLVAHALKD
jgi:cytochrome c oxidase assembly protein subunit 15